MPAMTELEIDGSTLEGGGQVLRCCLSLACLHEAPVRIHSIRAGRPKPGLANQHLAGAQLTATLSGVQLEGDTKGSTELLASPGAPGVGPGPCSLVADAQTAGAATLILQAALPPLLMRGSTATELLLRGGTDVNFSPPTAHATMVLAPLLARFGARLDVEVARRGFNPQGGGELRVTAGLLGERLRAVDLSERGDVREVR